MRWRTRSTLQGRYDEAEQLTRECEAACRPNDVHSQILWRSIRAKTLARRNEIDEALLLAHEAVVLAQESDFLPAHADALADLAELLRLAGREDDARAALEEAIILYEQKGNLLAAGGARASLEIQAENKRVARQTFVESSRAPSQ